MEKLLGLAVHQFSLLIAPSTAVKEQPINIDALLRHVPELLNLFGRMQDLSCHDNVIKCPFIICVSPVDFLFHGRKEALKENGLPDDPTTKQNGWKIL